MPHHRNDCSAGVRPRHGGVISSCVLLVVMFLIVLASKQFGFADFWFTGSFQHAHLLAPGSFQHWVESLDLFAFDQVSLGVNEGRLGFWRAANVELTFFLFPRQSPGGLWDCSAPHGRILGCWRAGHSRFVFPFWSLPILSSFRPRPSARG